MIDQNRRLIGLISVNDILLQLGSEFAHVSLVLEREGPHNVITR